MKNKVLLVMASGFPPQKFNGGPATSLNNFVSYLQDYFNIFVITQNFDNGSSDRLQGIKEYQWNDYGKAKVYYVNYEDNNYRYILKLLEEIKPDVIYQNSFFNAAQCLASLKYRKNSNTRLVLAPRGEFAKSALQIKKLKKYIYILYIKLNKLTNQIVFQGTSDQEIADIKRIFSKNDAIKLANFPTKFSGGIITRKKEKGKIFICFIGRIHRIKNILGAIKTLQYVNDSAYVAFDIYGPIEDKEYWEECSNIIKMLPPNINVTYCGYLNKDEIGSTLAKYDAFFSPTCGENYGHSIVEAMLNGKIVFISDKTPWTNVNKNCGYSFDKDDYRGFANAISAVANMDEDEYLKSSEQIFRFISDSLNIEETIDGYQKMFF